MPLDPANQDVVVFSRFLYRAESLANQIRERTSHHATAVCQPDPAILAAFETVLIDVDTFESALELIRAVIARRPEAKVVILGIEESEEAVVKLAEAGASGYATGIASLERLIEIVRSVQNSQFSCPPNITYALYSHLARISGADRAARRSPALTIREQRVLDLLSQSLTNKEIAASLCISEYTAKNHVHRILKKLGWTSRNLAASSGINRRKASAFAPHRRRAS